MKRKLLSMFLAAVIAVSCFCCFVTAQAANNGANKLNVVFVLDASGSMNQSDQSGLRYDALNLFLGLLTQQGNYVGNVIFTENVADKMDIAEIKGVEDKKRVLDNLKSVVPSKGDTNIGLALAAATDMLDSQRNTNLDSAIILLSDGNTDLKSKKQLEEADYYKEYAIGHARSGKYPIYCIGLNANGTMNGNELQGIADETGGKFIEVSTPNDLSKVTQTFYSMIYDTPFDTQEFRIGQNGVVEKPFTVPNIGIEEVNIVVRGKTTKVEIVKPDGSMMADDEVSNMTLANENTVNVKVANPQPGEWIARVYGDPGNEVTISMISNVDLEVRAEAANPKNVYKKGDNIEINATIVSQGADVTDEGVYNSNKAVLNWKNNTTGTEKNLDMTVLNGKYTVNVPLDEIASYEGIVKLTSDKIEKFSESLLFNVDNNPPELLVNEVTDKIVLWPFKHCEKTFDLSQYVKDDADSVLKYTVKDSSFKDGDVTLDNGILTVAPSVGVDGTITVAAADSKGASADIPFKINVVSVARMTIIILGIIALIVLAVLAFFAIKLARMKYYGKLMIQIYDKNTNAPYNRQIHEPYRGKQPIARLDSGAMDVGLEGAFRPKNTGYIIYESKRPFYCTTAPDRSVPMKKIDIPLGMTVTISDSEDFLTGANVTYM